MAITAQMVKELREKTDAPMMDCKKALEASNGDMSAAVDWLRTRGVAKAEKKAGREMAEGRVESYIHSNAKVGVLLEMHCETDFASRNESFGTVMKDICMHIAAADPAPIALDEKSIPKEMLEREYSIYEGQAKESGKPEQFWPKIIEGRMDKFKKSVALLEQPFVKNPDLKIKDLVTDLIAKLGENISVARFCKFRIGE
ncbi:MAG: translation elongation factor Ts [Planctomycetes bacterium]|nr:translation elongation factor Ts [Planctomycetota bacterium]